MARANDLVLKDREINCTLLKYKDLPVLQISTAKAIGYLTAFRGYRMQVSETIDGQGDFGSTTVVGFGNLVLATFPDRANNSSLFAQNMETVKGILYDLAMLAVTKWYAYTDQGRVPMAYKFEPAMEEWLVDTINWLTAKAKDAVRPRPVDKPIIGG